MRFRVHGSALRPGAVFDRFREKLILFVESFSGSWEKLILFVESFSGSWEKLIPFAESFSECREKLIPFVESFSESQEKPCTHGSTTRRAGRNMEQSLEIKVTGAGNLRKNAGKQGASGLNQPLKRQF